MKNWIQPSLLSLIFLIFIVLPVLLMLNCSGVALDGSSADHCFIYSTLLMRLAIPFFNLLYLSIFTFGIPILLYLSFVIMTMYFIYKMPQFIAEKRMSVGTIILLIVNICLFFVILFFVSDSANCVQFFADILL